jgi:hypothetical protein
VDGNTTPRMKETAVKTLKKIVVSKRSLGYKKSWYTKKYESGTNE